MKEAIGNIWSSNADAICVTTNGIVKANGAAVMGAGIAKQARDMFPGVDFRLGEMLNNGNYVYWLGNGLVSFPTKNDWRDKSDLELIVRSTLDLVALTDRRSWTNVALTRPGCGHGGLDWSTVKTVIEPMLDDRFTIWSPK